MTEDELEVASDSGQSEGDCALETGEAKGGDNAARLLCGLKRKSDQAMILVIKSSILIIITFSSSP